VEVHDYVSALLLVKREEAMASAELAPAIMQKLRSAELRAHAAENATAVETVLVEVNISGPRIRETPNAAETPGFGTRRFTLDSDDDRHNEETIKETRRFLTNVTGREPNFLSSSHVFITDANGDQLRKIAQHPFVQAIWPNRRLSSP
jgi:hypothetical protein